MQKKKKKKKKKTGTTSFRTHLSSLGSAVLERVSDDTFASRNGDELQALKHLGSVSMLNSSIQVLLVLANDDQVHLGMQRLDVRVVAEHWTHVGKEAQRLSQRHVQRLVALAEWRGDGALEQQLGLVDGGPGCSVQPRVDSLEVKLFAHHNVLWRDPSTGALQNVHRGISDFRT